MCIHYIQGLLVDDLMRDEMEKSRVVPIRLTGRDLEEVERFASNIGERSIGRAVKHAVLSYVFDNLRSEYSDDQTLMQETLRKISKMADLALDIEVKSSR